MLKRLTLCFSILFGGVVPSVALCENFRVATVDVNKIINGLPESKQKKAELDKLQKELETTLNARKSEIRKLQENLKNASDSNRRDAEDKLKSAVREYEKAANKANEDFQSKFLASNQELTKKVMSVIERYSKANKLSLVLDKNNRATSPLLYGDEAVDITAAIVREMNR